MVEASKEASSLLKKVQIAEERIERRGKGERERFTQLNTEFQRIARRDKKAFLSDQCKEIEVNNRMGKTTWFPPLGKMRPLPATASQGKSPVPP